MILNAFIVLQNRCDRNLLVCVRQNPFARGKGRILGDVGSENNLTKCTIHTKVETCLDNQDLMLPEPYIMLWAGE
jgi:hypothetical protein